MDWHAWHEDYDRADSALSGRLRVVREWLALTLDTAPPGPLRVVSVCAGQGRDLLGVLEDHPRRDDVAARLVELDPRNAAEASDAAGALGLDGVEVVTGDAALTDAYAGAVPADVVLACGIFGNVVDGDVRRAIGFLPQLVTAGGTVIWTRHRKEPDLVPQICHWLEDEQGFERVWLSEPDAGFGVGVHRFAGEPRPLAPGERMFTFTGRVRNGAGGN
ncbi:class I SAM-dependent methyltransferase family protein [Streptomyces sp. SBT349]|uniref:class I SAM-dependent methyltransferase family protein n=1 Tax=Streptomyces sp. SBT349 TaxID=1580539 RepID=UPI00066B8C6B|nr:class I SAM-dependent methyltransferase family protein [Streptomyces sp. SBT349]